ncbi:hypothetical protein HBH56_239930 [Parastagonospora nodorum]|nr:hypothetical protein HBH56_239930 [Parastagonospora nodorum]KAH4143317.1 hypothetical protein HBH45_039500 [Parastagonospora nodorum]
MLRRNGKPRSCEPCRISKIKCDHATPTCEKCVARGMVDQCFYHPNPMTKPAGTPRKKPEPRRRKADIHSAQDVGRLTSLTLSPPTLRNEVDAVPLGSWPTPPSSGCRGQSASHPVRSFYLGSTSYASVFSEDVPLPDTVHQQPSERMSATPSSVSSRNMGTRHCQIGVGHSVVSRLSPFSLLEKAMEGYYESTVTYLLLRPLILSLLPQLREDVQRLTAPGADLPQMYAEITRNTAKPLKIPPTMLPSEFHTALTGENLRWETLGLALALIAAHAEHVLPNDPFFTLDNGSKLDRDEFIEDLIQATNDCITLCQTHGAVSDIMVWLVCCNVHLVSGYYGDNYHGTYRRMSEAISALYATGMHCESEASKSEPLFMREARRRVHACIYRTDKTLALFLGRPPMMVWRYSDRRLLLDISDEAVCSDDPEVFSKLILSQGGSKTMLS